MSSMDAGFAQPISVQGDSQDLPLGQQIVTAIQGRSVSTTVPVPGQILGWGNANKQWTPLYPPGYEIGYDQITSSVAVTGTAASAGTTIISASAHTFDGALVTMEFFSPTIQTPSAAAGNAVFVDLWEGATNVARVAEIITPAAAITSVPVCAKLRFQPTAGSHTYTIKAYASNTTGTPEIFAGATGVDIFAPAYLRFTKV